jgi:uncharacterized membrane protein HdeD (DUF308 family)
MTKKYRVAKFVGMAIVTVGALGVLSTFIDRREATSWARAMLGTAATLASPVALIALGLMSWLVASLAKSRPASPWQTAWHYCKSFWKIYAGIVLVILAFVVFVSLSNLMALRHR